MRHFSLLFVLALFSFSVHAQNPIIAKQDFDNPVNLASESSNPALNSFSSSADGFGVYQRNVSSSIPFALLDDSDCGFAPDDQGIIGCNKTDAWFGVADTDNGDNPSGDVTASWTFDINNATDLAVSINMGAMGDFESSDVFNFEYSIDGGTPQPLFTGSTDNDASQTYTMEDGDMFVLNDPYIMEGVTLGNNLQAFTESIPGTGSQITITFNGNTNGSDEAFAFDDICITGEAGAPTCNEIFISEYIEGGGNNKCLELYNPTDAPIDLSAGSYTLERYANGSTSGSTITLSGIVPAVGVFVICNPNADGTLSAASDQTSFTISHNGDDAYELLKDGTVIDRFGRVGEDPGSEWSNNGVGTKDATLVRKASITSGDPNSMDPFDPSEEYDAYGKDDFSFIGDHTSNCVDQGGMDCMITNIEFQNSSGCQDNETQDPSDDFYTVDVVVTYENNPGSGDLELQLPGGGSEFVSASGLDESGSYTFTNIMLPADGNPQTVTATFTGDESGQCTQDGTAQAVGPCSAPACNPVINEVDYDQPGADDAEFVELYNPCNESINLGDYDLIFVNGSTSGTYNSSPVALPNVTLSPGEFFVVCTTDNTTTTNCDFQPSEISSIQNGEPDAIAISFQGSNVDALSYGGNVPGFTEGSGAADEPNNIDGIGLSRFPDGNDTNNNAADFGLVCITPGMPNTSNNEFCSLPPGYQVDQVGCNGNFDATFDENQNAFTISSDCADNSFTQDRGTYVTQQACGDFILDAKLKSIFPSNGYAGITVRESTAPGAKKFSIIQYPGNGRKNVEYRVTTNGGYQIFWFATWTVGLQYLRIERTGNLFKAYASFNGAPGSYQLMFVQMVPMSNCVRAGITVSAPFNGILTSAVFSDVSVTPLNGLLVDSSSDEEEVNEQFNGLSGAQLQNGSAAPQGFSVFPNPAVNELSIRFGEQAAAEATIRILSMEGRTLYEGVHGTQGATVTLPLSGLNMADGMYLISVTTGENVRTERFFKASR